MQTDIKIIKIQKQNKTQKHYATLKAQANFIL